MAIEKKVVEDRVTLVGDYNIIEVRTTTIVEEDGKEISRSYHRHIVAPDSDSSNESEKVKSLVSQFHTDSVKAEYKKWVDSNVNVPESS